MIFFRVLFLDSRLAVALEWIFIPISKKNLRFRCKNKETWLGFRSESVDIVLLFSWFLQGQSQIGVAKYIHILQKYQNYLFF